MAHPLAVTAKTNPDLDGVACAVAYVELLQAEGRAAVVVAAGRPDAEARYVLDRLELTLPGDPTEHVGGVALVDMSTLPGLPAFVDPAAVVEVIDHRLHGDPTESYPNASIQVEPVGAAATLVYERFEAAGIVPSDHAALLLQAAIHSNTQRLLGAVTTPRDRAAAESLAALHPMPPGFVEAQFQARAAEIVDDLPEAIRRETKTFEHSSGVFQVTQLECPGALDMAVLARAHTARPRLILNLVDPLLPASLILIQDPEFRAWVAARTGVRFDADAARPARALLRKQIVAQLLDEGEPS